MKKILFLLFLSVSIYGQTYQNPTFGTVTTKTSPTVTDDPYLTTTGTTGVQGKIAPVSVLIPYTPINYTISNQSIGQHLTGIDTRLGQISSTTAGLTQRVYFTADNTTVNSIVYFASSLSGKGSTATGSPPALVLADNTKGYFTKDIISIAQPSPTIGYAGTYSGNLTVSASPTPVATQQRFTVEIYRTNNLGVPIASGVSGAPVGDLGVTVLAILDSGIINLTAGSITNVSVNGILTQNVTINTGERLRYHVSAAKIGTGGGSVTFGVYYGSSYNSYYDVPVAITTDAVLNKSNVTPAITSTDALNNLKKTKTNIETVNILDYGAVGDGTTDNTTAIQNALNTGKNVFVPDGSFLVSSTLIIRSFQTLSGQSLNAEIKTNSNIVLISNNLTPVNFIERARIENIKLTNRFPVTAGAGATNWTVNFKNPLHCTMENVHVLGNFLDTDYNANNKGGALFSSDGSVPFVFLNTVKNCLFDKAAIRIETSDSDVLSSWIWPHPLGTPGIDIQSSNVSVQFCNGIIPARNDQAGIYLSPNAGLCRIENNFFDGSSIPVQSGWGIVALSNTDNVITGNTFWNCGRGGIKITDGALYTISNNSFRDNNRQDNSYSDILIIGSTFGTATITATGNTFWRNISHTNKAYAIQELNSGVAPILNNYSNNKILGQYLTPAISSNLSTTWGVQGAGVVPYINNTGDYVGINSSLVIGDGSDKSNSGLTDNDIISFNKGSNIQGRKGFPQLAISANAQGNWYGSTYKTSNPASQITIDGLGGTIGFYRATSGTYGNPITWLESGSFSNSGVFKVNNLSGTGTRTVVSDASGNLSATDTPPSRPYKVWVGVFQNNGTSAPTVTVNENTLGGAVVWTRTTTGTYRGTLSGVFNATSGKTNLLFGGGAGITSNGFFNQLVGTANYVEFTTLISGALSDSVLNGFTWIEIRVYP